MAVEKTNALELYQQAFKKRQEMKNINQSAIPNEIATPKAKGNLWDGITGTLNDIGNNVLTGIGKGIEGVVDFVAGSAGAIGSAFGADNQWAEDFVARDLTNEFFTSDVGKFMKSFVFTGGGYEKLVQGKSFQEQLNAFEDKMKYSYVNQLPEVAQDVVDGVTVSIGQMLPSIVIGVASGGAGLAPSVAKGVSMATFGIGAGGTSTEEALQQGNDLNQSLAYGTLQGAKEVGTELIGGALFDSKVFGVLGNGTSSLGKQSVKGLIKEVGKQAFGEGAEEAIGDLFEPLIKKVTIEKDGDLKEMYSESFKNMPLDFITGAITGAIMNGGKTLSDVGRYGVEGAMVENTISEAHGLIEEMVKLEKSGKLSADQSKKIQERLTELNSDYQNQMQAVYDKYGTDSTKGKNIASYKEYMDDLTTSSAQDLAIRDSIQRYNRKNKTNIGYRSLSQEQYTDMLKENEIAITPENISSNAFIDRFGNIVVNKNSEAYKSGKLYNKIGHEFLHLIEGSQTHQELFDNYVKGLSEQSKNDIIEKYQNQYGNQTEEYLLQEAFADYIGENITVNYQEFSKMLGNDSKWKTLKEKIFGYKGVLQADDRSIQTQIKTELNRVRERNIENKTSKTRGYQSNAKTTAKKFGEQSHNDILEALEKYFEESESEIVNDFVITSGNNLFIVDAGLEKYGEINYGVYDKIECETDINKFKEKIENDIREKGYYRKNGLRIRQNQTTEYQSVRAGSFNSNQRSTEQSLQSVQKQSSNNERGISRSDESRGIKQSKTIKENKNGYTDDFRRIQEESRGMSDEELQRYRSGSQKISDELYGRLSNVLQKEVGSVISRDGNRTRILENSNNFKIYENVDGTLFHDCFEIARSYLQNGELVDLHDSYENATCYLSDDGLSGFAITNDGDLISVFNVNRKRGFLRAISDCVKSNAKTLDCYVSSKQNLQKMYGEIFGFKTASIMDYNMEYDHDNIAKNHNNPKVAFMVNTETEVQEKAFTKTEYDKAVAYQQSYINEKKVKFSKNVETKKAVPKETDSAVSHKAFADLTQGKVYNKKSVERALDYLAQNVQTVLGGEVRVTYKNKQKIIDTVFHQMNTMVNHSPADIANTLNQSMENLLIDGKSVEGIFEITGDSHQEFIRQNQQTFTELLEDGRSGKVKRLTDYYTNKIERLQKRLANAIGYEKQLRETLKASEKLIKNHSTKIPTEERTSEYRPLSELQEVTDELATFIRRKDYINADSRESVKKIQNVFENSEALQEYYPEELRFDFETITTNIEEKGRSRLSIEEMKALKRIVQAIEHIYDNYDKAVIDGKKVVASELAKKGIQDTKQNHLAEKHPTLYRIKKLGRTIICINPITQMAYYQGVAFEGSFFESIYNTLRQAENTKNATYEDLVGDFIRFMEKKENLQKYKKKLSQRNIDVAGYKITDGEAVTVYFLKERGREALQHMLNNKDYNGEGITVRGKDYTKTIPVTDADLVKIEQYVKSNYAGLLEKVQDIFWNKASKHLNETAKERVGYVYDDLEEKYFPISVNPVDFNRQVGNLSELTLEHLEMVKPSFTKSVHKNANSAIFVEDILTVINNFARKMANYRITPYIQSINRVLNSKIVYNDREMSFMKYMQENVDNDFGGFMNKLLINMQGRLASGQKGQTQALKKIRSNLAKYFLGFNPKTIALQFASYPMIANYVGVGNMVRGLTMKSDLKTLSDRSAFFKSRFEDNGVQMAELQLEQNAIFEKKDKLGDLLTKPISKADNAMIAKIFNASLCEVAQKNKVTVKQARQSEALIQEAVDLTETIVRRTQSSYSVLDNGSFVFGANDIQKTFLMFTSDIRKMVSNFLFQWHQSKITGKKSYAVKAGTTLLASQIMVSMITALFQQLLNRNDEDKDGESSLEETTKVFGEEVLKNMSYGLFPFIKEIGGVFEGYEVSDMTVDLVNDLTEAVMNYTALVDADTTTKSRAWYNMAKVMGQVLGIPVKNIVEYPTAVLRKFNVEQAVRAQNILYNYTTTSEKTQMVRAYNKNQPSVVKANLSLILSKGGLSSLDRDSTMEIARLYKEGYQQVIPSGNIESFTINGQSYQLSNNAQKRFASVYDQATPEIEELISDKRYKKLSDEQKAQAIKRLYNAYYGASKAELIDTYEMSYQEQALDVMSGVDLVLALSTIETIKPTKTKTKKEQVLSYINSLFIQNKAKDYLKAIAGYNS